MTPSCWSATSSNAAASARAIAAALLNWPGVVGPSGMFVNPWTLQPLFKKRNAQIKIPYRIREFSKFPNACEDPRGDDDSRDV
jgi:2-methylcitrate dehydratase PrpD